MNRSHYAFVVGTAVLGLSAFTACGGGNDTSAGTQTGSSQSAPSQSQSAGAAGEVKLTTAEVDKLGTIVTDGTGRTVYVFDKDTASPSKSNCDGDCAMKWPPVMAGTGAPQLDSVDASAVGTVTRTDGSKQLTLGGLPLYLFVNDSEAGDAKGQGVGGAWWVVGPDGKKITTPATDSGSGY